jgi:hypothetical protein
MFVSFEAFDKHLASSLHYLTHPFNHDYKHKAIDKVVYSIPQALHIACLNTLTS